MQGPAGRPVELASRESRFADRFEFSGTIDASGAAMADSLRWNDDLRGLIPGNRFLGPAARTSWRGAG